VARRLAQNGVRCLLQAILGTGDERSIRTRLSAPCSLWIELPRIWEMVDNRFANMRAAQAKVKGAMREYLLHLREEGAELNKTGAAQHLIEAA
jgi:hypothetical protein